ncbi:MAG: 2-oxoacid:ferredoxin oxidoreductase subunit beta [Dictyoglomus sp.]|jgi:2-oxoglutarate ferredoxin oxidoreductase subunit beta|uniref:Pyruvate ferredoxin/flavodoxin oxidoreductase, beta subunit n=1 Tax=Dictyoglomus turgidum (strain DSM 6724 / Z-1310) TaxID=515635 RepID=B8E376_DICTD|nr:MULTISPECIES: 2-oxoacid:ferredoxin oxidoreductase subunit beta [Dictyoglomus]ACK42950.1 pyruvate ferredoxin/flavodoxin oxidoreductase, beta subunit [Dictyoglomus turgidum DSM 6724]HBU31014.1 2-oxoacid:ferredoxin oxidoreductase subunit beta [Dictyoglomus sp.]
MRIEDFENNQIPAWCPGCGNWSILNCLKRVLSELEIKPKDLLMVSGIGQAAKAPHYFKCNLFNGLHGRDIPAAVGAKIANKDLIVICESGDGNTYGEGGNHLIHNIRRNLNIKVFVHNNQIYGLTKGQASPTSDQGMKTKVQPLGVPYKPLNPIALAISQGASFVARSFSGDPDHLVEMMKQAILHKGFALLDILQPCVTFNRINTYQWYKERIYKLGPDYDPTDVMKAFEKSLEWGNKIPIGIIYKNERQTFEEILPQLKGEPLYKKVRSPVEVFEKIVKEFQ